VVIACNADPHPVEVTWTGLEERALRERFEPFEVRIHRVRGG